jgi:hypothetical protein
VRNDKVAKSSGVIISEPPESENVLFVFTKDDKVYIPGDVKNKDQLNIAWNKKDMLAKFAYLVAKGQIENLTVKDKLAMGKGEVIKPADGDKKLSKQAKRRLAKKEAKKKQEVDGGVELKDDDKGGKKEEFLAGYKIKKTMLPDKDGTVVTRLVKKDDVPQSRDKVVDTGDKDGIK